MTIFIYSLTDPRDSRVRYIGQSAEPEKRYQQHIRSMFGWDSNREKQAWIQELYKLRLRPEMKVIEECVDFESANAAERKHIQQQIISGNKLTNIADGGAGCSRTIAKRATPQEWIEFGNAVKAARQSLIDAQVFAAKYLGAKGSDEIGRVVQRLDQSKTKFDSELFKHIPCGEFRSRVFYGDPLPAEPVESMT